MSVEKKLFNRIMAEGHHFDHNAYLDMPSKDENGEELEPVWLPEYMDIELKCEREEQKYVDGFYPGIYRCYVMSLYVRLSEDWKEPLDERVRVRYEVFRIKNGKGEELPTPNCVCNVHGGCSRTFPMPAFFDELPRFEAWKVAKRMGV